MQVDYRKVLFKLQNEMRDFKLKNHNNFQISFINKIHKCLIL